MRYFEIKLGHYAMMSAKTPEDAVLQFNIEFHQSAQPIHCHEISEAVAWRIYMHTGDEPNPDPCTRDDFHQRATIWVDVF